MTKSAVYETGKRISDGMANKGVPQHYFELLADLIEQAVKAEDLAEENIVLKVNLRTLKASKIEVVKRIRKISKAKVPPELINTPIGADLINIHIELNRIEQEAGDVVS
jgi:hypothetical protein